MNDIAVNSASDSEFMGALSKACADNCIACVELCETVDNEVAKSVQRLTAIALMPAKKQLYLKSINKFLRLNRIRNPDSIEIRVI